jgi:hypothetical protein
VNTCILGSSTPYWHCGLPEAPATWYTSCYDFPATSHPGNNNYWYAPPKKIGTPGSILLTSEYYTQPASQAILCNMVHHNQ